MRRVKFVIVLGALAMLPRAALADATSETATALKHAYQAAQSGEIKLMHADLHRVVNCLVGPGDKQFDATETNPCAKDGNGAIPDTLDATKKKHLQDAVEMSELGIASNDPVQAMMMATGAAGALRQSESSASEPAYPH